MGILKGIPYTKYGLNYIDGIKGNDGVDDINRFVTFAELFNIIGELEKYVIDFIRSNPQIKALTVYDNLNTTLLAIQENLDRDMQNIFNELFKSLGDSEIRSTQHMYYSDIKTETGGVVVKTGKYITEKLKRQYENSTLALVKKFNTESSASGGDKKYKLKIEDFQLDNNGIFIDKLTSYDFLKEDGGQAQSRKDNTIYNTQIPYTFTEFQNTGNINNYNIFKITGDAAIDTYKEKIYNYTVEYVQLKSRKNNDELRNCYTNILNIQVLDIRLVLEKINIIKEKLKNDFTENKNLITKEFSKSINSFLDSKGTKFDASIGSLFEILCDHVDLFIKVIKRVEYNIENDRKKGDRNLSEASKNDFTQYKEDGAQAYVGAFPEYIESESNDDKDGLVEKWLGSNDKFRNFEEVKFIEDLYNSMIKSAKKDKTAASNVFSEEKGWFPVNPLETIAFNKNNKNPWESVANSNIQTVMKLILQRMTIYLSYTNKNLTTEEISKVAAIEANQL